MEGENQSDETLNEGQQNDYYSADYFSRSEDGFADVVSKRSFKEKMLVGLVVLVSLTAVYLGYYKLSSTINSPFVVFSDEDESKIRDAAGEKLAAVLELQTKDTDGDGLSDYDELNVYQTSPYLADSDSDKISDKNEVDASSDPNCPGNESCFHSDIISTSESQENNTNNQLLLSGQASSDMLREVLLQNGFSADALDAMSDEDLQLVYESALSGNPDAIIGQTQTTEATTTDSNSGSDSSVSIDDLRNLTAAQIRELLIQQGTPASLLDQVDDEQLKQMFLEKLDSQVNSQ